MISCYCSSPPPAADFTNLKQIIKFVVVILLPNMVVLIINIILVKNTASA
jgi:hypothetical protein